MTQISLPTSPEGGTLDADGRMVPTLPTAIPGGDTDPTDDFQMWTAAKIAQSIIADLSQSTWPDAENFWKKGVGLDGAGNLYTVERFRNAGTAATGTFLDVTGTVQVGSNSYRYRGAFRRDNEVSNPADGDFYYDRTHLRLRLYRAGEQASFFGTGEWSTTHPYIVLSTTAPWLGPHTTEADALHDHRAVLGAYCFIEEEAKLKLITGYTAAISPYNYYEWVHAGALDDLDGSIFVPADQVTVSGSNSITLSPDPPIADYYPGLTLRFVVKAANTGGVLVRCGTLENKHLRRRNDAVLAANDLVVGHLITITYDGTRFRADLVSADTSGSGSGGGLSTDPPAIPVLGWIRTSPGNSPATPQYSVSSTGAWINGPWSSSIPSGSGQLWLATAVAYWSGSSYAIRSGSVSTAAVEGHIEFSAVPSDNDNDWSPTKEVGDRYGRYLDASGNLIGPFRLEGEDEWLEVFREDRTWGVASTLHRQSHPRYYIEDVKAIRVDWHNKNTSNNGEWFATAIFYPSSDLVSSRSGDSKNFDNYLRFFGSRTQAATLMMSRVQLPSYSSNTVDFGIRLTRPDTASDTNEFEGTFIHGPLNQAMTGELAVYIQF